MMLLSGPAPLANYSEFPKSCLQQFFAIGEQRFQMLIDGWNGDLKQLRHEQLRQPEGIIHKTALHAGTPIFCFI